MKIFYFLQVSFSVLDHIRILLSFLALFLGAGKLKKAKMADPRWPPFKNMMQFLHHMMSPPHAVDLSKERDLDVLSAL